MKIGIIGDIHFNEYSSILRERGEYFSVRLENCIKSINWAEEVTADCDQIVYLGDFFDSSSLNAEELTALSQIEWNDRYHRFLVGNHEMGINNLMFSSAHVFDKPLGKMEVVSQAYLSYYDEGTELCFLPYILEEDRQPLAAYFPPRRAGIPRIIFSHNDLAGVQMGQFLSKAGFTLDEIGENCDYFFNGHLHNGARVTNKILNVGNLTGQNFSEDGFKYTHNIFVFDTDTMNYVVLRNPYAINFYKLDSLDSLKHVVNGAITLKVDESEVAKANELIKNNPEIVASRVIVNYSRAEKRDVKELSVDHLDEFRKFVHEKFKDDPQLDLVREELEYIYG